MTDVERKIQRHLRAILDTTDDLILEVGIPGSATELANGSRMRQLAFCECIRRVGEAVAHIDALDDQWLRTAFPAIPWRDVKSTRNRLTHHDWTVDHQILFDIATIHLPRVTGPVADHLGAADPFAGHDPPQPAD